MRLLRENTMAMVIDIQERLLPAMGDAETLIKHSKTLLEGLVVLGVETMITCQYPKGLGVVLPELMHINPSASYYEKAAFSCYDDAEIKKHIDASGKKNIILIGIESHVCVLQTLIDLRAEGYNCVLVEDCITSRKASDKKTALRRAVYEGAIITSYESLLFELTRTSGTAEFKAISKLIK